jgi:type 1 glutamine amidotransferase
MRKLASGLAAGLTLLAAAPLKAAETGFQPLFNGKDLTGWTGNPALWSVRDGAITGVTQADPKLTHNTFLVYTNAEFGDFELRLSYRIVAGNSGIQYRSKVLRQGEFGPIMGGYQADFEAGRNYSGILYEEQGRGILAQRGQKVILHPDPADAGKLKIEVTGSVGNSDEIQSKIKSEQWNDYVIVAQGNHLKHFINGVPTVDVVDEHAEKAAASGVIALQIHVGPPMTVQFKDIRLKRLAAADAKIVLIAGGASHGPGDHEHRAGMLLLARCLNQVPGVQTVVVSNGWPTDLKVFEDAAAVAIYSDGGGGHPFVQEGRLAVIDRLMKQGVGLGCIHYAVEVPKDNGGPEFLRWIGGYFETHWSVNPHWLADFKSLPQHPVTRGVQPFKVQDEWYYHMRFAPDMKGVTPILSALPPADTLNRPDGPHSNNPAVRKAVLEDQQPQHVMWVFERPDGGRGFGFTGGHFHKEWGNDNFRRVVLNALLWIAKVEVPPGGVQSRVTADELRLNLDVKGR